MVVNFNSMVNQGFLIVKSMKKTMQKPNKEEKPRKSMGGRLRIQVAISNSNKKPV